MKNSRPFDIILDSYSNESAQLYAVVRTLFNYPSITEDEDLDGKLYASAFAFICQEYLVDSIEIYPHGDFPLFVELMGFEQDNNFITKKCININIIIDKENDISDKVWVLMRHYQTIIKKDLGNIFSERDKLSKLFASIFSLSDDDYMPTNNHFRSFSMISSK
jgi:hypothetical protein